MSEEQLTMDDFSAELEASFKKIEEGDMLTGTVISVDEKEVILDLKYYAEGVIRAEDFSNEPGFSLKDAVQVGDEITATVIRKDDGHGNILLSRAEANDILAWEKLAQYKEEKTVLDVKVKGIVNAGVIAYVEGIRGFIPASKLSLNYVEDLNEYLNKDIQVQVFDLDKEKDRLILSAREILREKADEERKEKISNVEVGLVTEGTVESLQPYGAFISLGNGLSGLVHISQICAKRIKHPSAVLAVDGITLSGGEMQKLMMARALYKNCHLLLLDEPTAALDAISENKMYEIYSTLLKNKTALFISHRLASTRFCDTILFLENGKIKECGTHDELIALGGSYAHMFEVQSQYYQETEEDI